MKDLKIFRWLLENPDFDLILIICAPERYAPIRWSKRKSSPISSMLISTSLLRTTEVVSGVTLRFPDGLHSILTWSLAASPCTDTHFLGRLTM